MRAGPGTFLLSVLLLSALGAGAQSGPAPSGGAQSGPAPSAGAQGAPATADQGPAMIGLGLEEVLARLGAPAEVFSVRGAAEKQDDVVFYYPQHLYLFWFQNRVWQVRYDRRHSGAPFSLSMGVSRQRAIEVLGQPLREHSDASDGSATLVYHLEDRGYPVRLRLYFEEGSLVDLYCYRADL